MLGLALVATLLGISVATAQVQPEAAAILARVAKTYRTVPAFACEGTYAAQDKALPGETGRRTVRILFARPDKLRLAWTETDFDGKTTTNVIFRRRGQVRFHWETLGTEEKEGSLTDTIDATTGISLGLSSLIPSLLLGRDALQFASLRRLADARSEDGHRCWRLAGKRENGVRQELLIDQRDHALRQVDEIEMVPPYTAMQVRTALAKTHPAMAHAPLPPARTLRTRYRFRDNRFAGVWPEGAFDLNESQGAGKR